MTTYTTRRHQIAGFLRELALPPRYRRKVARALRDAAMVGAAEERRRALGILRANCSSSLPAQLIVERSVLDVLGWPTTKKETR